MSLPIILASIAVAVSITLLVFWLLIVVRDYPLGAQVSDNTWLIVLGSVAFAFIMTVLVFFGVFLREERMEAQRQDRFIDSVTHELKSPLASIQLCLETLGRTGLRPDQRDEVRSMAIKDVQRLKDFIDDILAASRLPYERAGHDIVEVAPAMLVDEVITRVARRHKEDPAVVSVDIPRDLMLNTDATALETVMLNLVDNAMKYSDPPRQVSVSARIRRDLLELTIADNGIGIPQAHLKQVFQRFHRVPLPSVRKRHGTGLGLYVVKALVDQLGGRLDAQSEGPMTGTSVKVTIPVTLTPRQGANSAWTPAEAG